MTILVTGATGTVGSVAMELARAAGAEVRAGIRTPTPIAGAVRFDFTDPSSWDSAFDRVERMLLVRPPAMSNVRRDMIPALEAARAAGVRHVVLLSVQGADRNRAVPHARIESWLRGSGLDWTFIRPSFFMQNLTTTHLSDIRDRSELVLPAGSGRTAFVDARDVASVAVEALVHPSLHRNAAYTPTGSSAVTYDTVADILTAELGRPIRYRSVGVARWGRHARTALAMPWAMVAVTTAIYLSARLGLAAGLTDDVRQVTGHSPTTFRGFAHRERSAWL